MRFARHNLKYYNDKMALRGEDEDVEEDSEETSSENPISRFEIIRISEINTNSNEDENNA